MGMKKQAPVGLCENHQLLQLAITAAMNACQMEKLQAG
jgi:hypothetical protein